MYKETDILVRKFRHKKNLYKVIYKEKMTMYNDPIEFQLCYFSYAFERLITLVLVQSWLDWSVPLKFDSLILMSDRKVIQRDIAIRLKSLIFSWTSLSGFQSTRIPFFPKPPFQVFDLLGVHIFSICISLIFTQTLLVHREALIFSRPFNLAGLIYA